MNRLMIDFETLDIAECPVILSMGAVVFNENGIVDCFFEKIDQHSCLDLGCTVSIDTLLWWEQQTEAARAAAFGGKTNIGYAMGMLVDFYKKHECGEIWSKGAIADIRWANNILDKLSLEKPWKFWQEMCFRTYVKYSDWVDFEPTGEAHNALDDATNQAKHWISIYHRVQRNQEILFCLALDLVSDIENKKSNQESKYIQQLAISPQNTVANGEKLYRMKDLANIPERQAKTHIYKTGVNKGKSRTIGARPASKGITGVSEKTIWEWVKTGYFPQPVRIGGNITTWRASEIDQWLNAHGGGK